MGKREEDKQYEMGLKEPFSNRFWNIRNGISKRLIWFETHRFIKSSTVWFLISMLVLINLLLLNYYRELLTVAPSEIPLYNNYIQLSPRLVALSDLYIILLASLIFSIMLLLTASKIFNRKPYISYFILIITVLSLVSALINLVSLTNQYL